MSQNPASKNRSVQIRRTIVGPDGTEGKEDFFTVPLNNANRVIGAGVNNKIIYDLKKRGRAEYIYSDGSKFVFEVVTPELLAKEAKAAQELLDAEMIEANGADTQLNI